MNKEQYALICSRRESFDALVWQTPPLAIAAQAFLLAASFSRDMSALNAFVVALFSAFLGVAAVQLLAKHRQCEIEDSERLRLFEIANAEDGFEVLHGKRDSVVGVARPWWVRISAFRVWLLILSGFVCLALYAACSALSRF